MIRLRLPVLVAALALATGASESVAQVRCEPCHGEFELLRQRAPTLEEARALLVSSADLEDSAHRSSQCLDCHRSYGTYPHPPEGSTESCASCHTDQEAEWSGGIHGSDTEASCAACHGVHRVRDAEELAGPAGMLEMRLACEGCHVDERMSEADPHADSLACVACHESHGTLPPSSPAATVHTLNQAQTCGTCHDSIASVWGSDAHALALVELSRPGATRLDGATGRDPPVCTGCHGTHRSADPAEAEVGENVSARCAGCHEDYAESFADSYHGQAGELGSTAVARCHDCHSAHEVYPVEDSRSTVSDARRLETCRSCHPRATAGFAGFQPHADPHDRERYPQVYWSYRGMMALLAAVFTVFGLHSVLWLGRSAVDALREDRERGAPHG
jgi:predicted CXXCH cytochrome family protein